MKHSIEYLDFIGITSRDVLKVHIIILIKRIFKSYLFWFVIGLISGATAFFFLFCSNAVVSTTYEKEIVYVPSISIDSTTKAFMNAIATFESGGNYKAVNGSYLGKYQIGDDLRKELGFGGLNTRKGHEQFLNTPELQDIIMALSIRYSEQQLDYYIKRYSNTKVGAHYLTKSGIIAIAHACGIQGCKSFIDTKGNYTPNNGRKVTDYLQFNNFKL